MGILMPVGVVLITVGLAGTAAACYQSGVFDTGEQHDTSTAPGTPPAEEATGTRSTIVLAPLAGLTLALGLGCVGVGIGHWKRPILSNTRPANPWSDQPGEHGDPPKGLV